MKDLLNTICEWLNENYNQESENYSIFFGSKPGIIRYNEHIAISPWACGAIVCINDLLYFIEEDDGQWFIRDDEDWGYQTVFSIGWIQSFIDAMNLLKEYVDKNGTPVYFSGTDVICHYTL